MLSVILTASVLFPGISGAHIVAVLVGGSVTALLVSLGMRIYERRRGAKSAAEPVLACDRSTWRMPPLSELAPAQLTRLNRIWLIVLRGYLIIAAGLVLVRIAQLVSAGH
jgi:hypothetical protein